MKKLLSFVLCMLVLLATASCTGKRNAASSFPSINSDNEAATDELTSDTDGVTSDDGSTEEQVEVPVETPEKAAPTKEELLDMIGAHIDGGLTIDNTAQSFMQALRDGDKQTVSSLIYGKIEHYDFLDSNPVEDYIIHPLKIIIDDYEYTDNYRRSYLCEITTSGENEYFASPVSLYYLETTSLSELGNPVYYFLPLEDAVDIFHPNPDIPDKYYYLTEKLSDAYGLSFVLGENPASSIDFNNVAGYHFIPHALFYFENKDYYDMPHSMTQINEFIRTVFSGNGGVNLESDADYELWVSDIDARRNFDSLTEDDEVYGCSGGHGGTWAMLRICGFEETKGGINITVRTYADYAHFTKAKTMIFKYAPDVEGELPLLYSVEVIQDTGYTTAYGSI